MTQYTFVCVTIFFFFSQVLFVSRFLKVSFETKKMQINRSFVRSHTWNFNFRFQQTFSFSLYISSGLFVNRLITNEFRQQCKRVCWSFFFSVNLTLLIVIIISQLSVDTTITAAPIMMTTAKRNSLATLWLILHAHTNGVLKHVLTIIKLYVDVAVCLSARLHSEPPIMSPLIVVVSLRIRSAHPNPFRSIPGILCHLRPLCNGIRNDASNEADICVALGVFFSQSHSKFYIWFEFQWLAIVFMFNLIQLNNFTSKYVCAHVLLFLSVCDWCWCCSHHTLHCCYSSTSLYATGFIFMNLIRFASIKPKCVGFKHAALI